MMFDQIEIVRKEHYTVLKHAFSREWCDFFADYARLKAEVSPCRLNNADALKRVHREYADPAMELCLQKLTPWIEQALGYEVFPTLSFYYTYQHGQQLLPHKDRSSCQIVAGVSLGADAAYRKQQGVWPLYFSFESGKEESIPVEYGDLILFKGHTTTHWRKPFAGEWFVSAIFGFVEKQGPFAFQKYDQRKRLGDPHVGMFKWSLGCLQAKIKNYIQLDFK